MESGRLVDDEFEFSFECSSLPGSPVRADVVFYDWKMKQLFPMISSGGEITEEANIIIIHEEENVNVNNVGAVGSRREMKPLLELMKLEKEFAFSSDEADDYYNRRPPGGKKQGKSIWSCRFLDLLRKGSSVHGESSAAAAVVGVGRRRRRRSIN